MLIKEVMTTPPDVLEDTMTIKQAAQEMQKYDFGFIPVAHNGKAIGVVTDRDIVIRGLTNGANLDTLQLKDVMTKNLEYCHENDDVKMVTDLMCHKQISRVVVFDKEDKNITGVVSIGDIARKCQDPVLSGKLSEAIHKS